jgi:hypothetical protein
MTLSTTQDIVGNFNSHLAGRLLVLGDEGVWGGNKRDDGALKNLITSENIAIERKHFSKVSMSNYTRFIFCSNEQWVVPSSFDMERRFLVLDVDPARQNDFKYFGAIQDQLDRGGYEALMADLLEWRPPEGGWRVLGVAPQTAAVDEQKVQSAEVGVRFLIEVIERGGFPSLGGDTHRLNVDQPNIVAHQPLLLAFRTFVEQSAGIDRSRTDTTAGAFRRLLVKVVFAENEGKDRPVRPHSNGIVACDPHYEQSNRLVQCVRFPSLREIVERHREAGWLGFDTDWEQEAGDEDDPHAA